jgi:hypothetical protein
VAAQMVQAMTSEMAKGVQEKPQQQDKPKLKFVEFGRFSTLRISTADTENGTIVNVRKGEQFVTFLFNQEVANGLLQLIEKHYPNLLNSPKNKRGRGA